MRYVPNDMLGACAICCQVKPGGYIDAGPADIICLDCAKEIAKALECKEQENEQGKEQREVIYTCSLCGRTFANQYSLMAHHRHCKGVKGGDQN